MNNQKLIITLLLLLIVVLSVLLVKGKRDFNVMQTTNNNLLDTIENYKLKLSHGWYFDGIEARQIAKSYEIMPTDTFQAEVFLKGINWTPEYEKEAILILGERIDKYDKLAGRIDTLPVRNWVGEVKIIPKKLGKNDLFLDFLIPSADGYDVYPIRTSFIVQPNK